MKSKKQVRRHRNKSKKFRKMKGGESLNRQLFDACSIGNIEVAMALVDRGADLDARNHSGNTPLHIACYGEHRNLVIALVDRGANINAINNAGNTPLHGACSRNNVMMAMELIDQGANTNIVNVFGRTPLDYLSRENKERLDLMINWHMGNVMNSMIDSVETRSVVDEIARDPSSRLNRLPEELVNHANRFLGGKRKTKKRKTRRRKTRKH